MHRQRTCELVACSWLLLPGACGDQNTRRPLGPEPTPRWGESTSGTADRPRGEEPALTVTITAVAVDTRLAAMCGLPGSKVFFEFDAAKVPADASPLLEEIAACVQSGPARGQRLAIVGRAGPLGSERYNERLGLSRAYAVANDLRARGVPDEQIRIESRGEAQADESRPSTWPSERRVTIRLDQANPNGGAR
jgi:outer membrane protein OmpA-like peptidoglycan-associated protein